ncbi:MAG: class I SAM-dependent methyltransferase [Thermodesulfobacteriota bacterium]
MYLERFLQPVNGKRILDIGCGCADILKLLPAGVEYVGYDLSREYIEYAQRKYGHRAEFHLKRVKDITLDEKNQFDIVLADGLLHHLSDTEAAELFRVGHDALSDHGFMFTVDPTVNSSQRLISRWISLMDRGMHVRTPEQYHRIACAVFPAVEITVIDNVSGRPQTGCFLKCYKTSNRK